MRSIWLLTGGEDDPLASLSLKDEQGFGILFYYSIFLSDVACELTSDIRNFPDRSSMIYAESMASYRRQHLYDALCNILSTLSTDGTHVNTTKTAIYE